MKPMRISEHVWITLDDGGTHETQEGGATDEGFDMTSSVYEREDETITLNVYREARDCDGALSSHLEMTWTVDGPLNENGYPVFDLVDQSQRDHEAEKAGY